MPDTNFEVSVKTALITKKTTLTELAKDLGIGVSYLSDIVRGNRAGGAYKKKLCEMLEIEYDEK